MRRLARVFEIAALCLLLSGISGGTGAIGQEASFGGFTTSGTAATWAWSYNQPSAGVPASPTMELNGLYTEARLASGPSGYANASLLWPGQVVANVPGFVWDEFWHGAEEGGYPPEYKPPVPRPTYPVRAETFYPQGPEEASQEPGGGAEMRSSARREGAQAYATADRSGFPIVASMGSQTSRSSSVLEEGFAVARARAIASDIELFGGLITIDTVVTHASAATDGSKGEVSGAVTVSGMVIDGHPVRIEGSGIHIDGEDHDPGLSVIRQQIQQTLARLGVTFAVADPVDTVEGPSATRSIGGLIVGFSASGLKQYLENLPEGLRQEIEKQVPMDQTVLLTIAGVAVRSATTEEFGGFEFGGDVPAGDAFVSGGGFEAPAGPGGVSAAPAAGLTEAPSAPGTASGAEGVPAGTRRSFPSPFGGLPAGLVIGALALAAVGSRVLAKGADTALAARASVGCPYEDA